MDQVVRTNNIGDIHNGDYVSWSLYNGQKCIRKPRPADIERAFKAFLLKLEEEGFLFVPGCVEILFDDGNEHYVAVTEHKEMEKLSEVLLYFRRCGALLFFAYLFSSTDLHRENIIANGSIPVIIDFETLFTGDDRRTFDNESPVMLSDSVWNSYLLPRWVRLKSQDIDASGFTGHVNIDSFELNPNIPYFNGKPLYAWNHVEDVLEGFCYAYNFFIERKDKAGEWIDLFQNCTFRVILRKTDIYAKLISLLEDFPLYKREFGADLLLRRAYENDVDNERLDRMKEVLAEEIYSVSHGEIPLFYVKGDSKDIGSRGKVLSKNYYLRSPIAQAKWKLSQLSPINRDGQAKIISQLFSAAKPLSEKNNDQKLEGEKNSFITSVSSPAIQIYNTPEACFAILEKIEEKCINGMLDGWLYLNRGFNGPVSITGIGMGLYHGLTGILCFYAALFSKTGDDLYKTKLLKYYEPIKKKLESAHILLDSKSASLNYGVGGILLALYHIGELTGINDFIIDAEALVGRISIPEILEKGNTDVLCGYAGLAVALQKVRDTSNAKRISKALIPTLVKEEPTLTGYAHGAAGYALAMGVLAYILNDTSYNEIIIKWLKWESEFYNSKTLNWRDLRSKNSKFPVFMNGWCSGTPGIIMSRQALLNITDDNRIKEICSNDLFLTKNWFKLQPLEDYDNLCCGNAAKIMAASRLGIDAQNLYKNIIMSVEQDSLNFQHLIGTSDFIPGLMQGYAGIGYALTMYGDKRCGGMLV